MVDPRFVPPSTLQVPPPGGWPPTGSPAPPPQWGTDPEDLCFPTGPGRQFSASTVGCPAPAAIKWWPIGEDGAVEDYGSEMAQRRAFLNPGFGPAWRLACEFFTNPEGWANDMGRSPETHPEWESRLRARFIAHGHGLQPPSNWRMFGNFAVKVGGANSLGVVADGELLEDVDFMLDLSILLRLTRLCVLEATDYFSWIPRDSFGTIPSGPFPLSFDFFEALRLMATEDVVFLSFSESPNYSGYAENGRSNIRLSVRDMGIHGQSLARYRYAPPSCSNTSAGSARLRDALLAMTGDVGVIVHEICHGVWLSNFGLPSGANNQFEGPDFRTFESWSIPRWPGSLPWYWRYRQDEPVGVPGQPAAVDIRSTRIVKIPQEPFNGGLAGHPSDVAFSSRHWVCEWTGIAVGGWGLGEQLGSAYALENTHLWACSDDVIAHGGVDGYLPRTIGETLLSRPACFVC